MPSIQWLKTVFESGYDSGNVLSRIPNRTRWHQERLIGGSYRHVFQEAVAPSLLPDSRVLELGPGVGSWSRAILEHIPDGELQTADYVDLEDALQPSLYDGRLIVQKVDDNSFDAFGDDYFDLFFSFGVLCHNPGEAILEILTNSRPKVKPGGMAVHHHGDWLKLEAYGWKRGAVPLEFKDLPDEDIWWPRNDSAKMAGLAREAGWEVVTQDADLLSRDGIIRLRNPG